MNQIKARITAIKRSGEVSIVTFYVAEQVMRMMSLALAPEIEVGMHVTLGVKATSIMLAKGLQGEVSTSNQLQVHVDRMEWGELLCSVRFLFDGVLLESVITRASAEKMSLKEGDAVVALIKSSELSILELL